MTIHNDCKREGRFYRKIETIMINLRLKAFTFIRINNIIYTVVLQDSSYFPILKLNWLQCSCYS